MARELFRESLRLENESHIKQHAALTRWGDLQRVYLNEKEVADGVAQAKVLLGVLGACAEDVRKSRDEKSALEALGKKIKDAKCKWWAAKWAQGSALTRRDAC